MVPSPAAVTRARAALRERRFCKIIIGLGRFDLPLVERMACLYAWAGAHALDVAPRTDVVAAALRGFERAVSLRSDVAVPLLMVSLGLPGDPHVAAGAPAWQGDLVIVADCLAAGAQAVELHATGCAPDHLADLVASLQGVLGAQGPLALSLGGPDLATLRHQIAVAEAVAGQALILQIEALPMGGARHGEPDAPSIELALAVRGAIVRSALQLAGGANRATRAHCHARGLDIDGIGIGTAAHAAIAEALRAPTCQGDEAAFVHWCAAARALVDAATGDNPVATGAGVPAP
ncbi:MAG: hypothetical protein EXR79_02275 [Myxococcales bacterium]|nr:hypothetical protein [Myxococcales bacterium]